jgi:hypothetical protein
MNCGCLWWEAAQPEEAPPPSYHAMDQAAALAERSAKLHEEMSELRRRSAAISQRMRERPAAGRPLGGRGGGAGGGGGAPLFGRTGSRDGPPPPFRTSPRDGPGARDVGLGKRRRSDERRDSGGLGEERRAKMARPGGFEGRVTSPKSSLKQDDGMKKRASRMFGILTGTLNKAKKELTKDSAKVREPSPPAPLAPPAPVRGRPEAGDSSLTTLRSPRRMRAQKEKQRQALQRADQKLVEHSDKAREEHRALIMQVREEASSLHRTPPPPLHCVAVYAQS